ncbi:MAG: TldD/PmbA family protein [Candidatus Saganbacteria bacterium]|nr:TldD/PmbA family protein [Candidatus Saganbacteria bacterium]
MINTNDILNKLKNKADQAEVFLSKNRTLTIDVLDGKVEAIKEVEDIGCAIRLIKDKRLGFAYTSEFDESVIESTIGQALANAANAEPDENNCLPAPCSAMPSSLDLYDREIDEIKIKEKVRLALEMEDSAYKADERIKKTERVSYSDGSSEIELFNSLGLAVAYKTNMCGGFAQMIAGSDGNMEAGFGVSFTKKFADFDPAAVGEESAQRAALLLGAKHVKSRKLPLLIDPVVGAEIISAMVAALTAEAVQKGKSMFADKLGQLVAAQAVTVIDDGRLPNGLSSAPFDAEGSATQETKLIDKGKLLTFLYNAYTAKKGGVNSTGNAVRGSFMNLPGTGTTNLYIPAGPVKPEEMLASIKHGLFITRVMGMHTVNPISGNFSVGAAGLMIENGEKTYPVRGITIAGNLIEMLKQIEAVGSDLRFIEDIGSPTLLIHDMSVSGG